MSEELNRRERKKIEAREKIIATALELFTQKGLEETTIAEIMNRANLGTGTFYNYFDSKEHLLNHFIEEKITEAKSSLETLNKANLSPWEKLAKILLAFAKVFEENKLLIIFFNSSLKANPSMKSPGNHGHIFRETFLKIIKDGQTQGEITSQLPPKIIMETIHGIIISALTSTNPDFTLTANLTYKITLLSQGILTRGGI